jgi:hypothetical protein
MSDSEVAIPELLLPSDSEKSRYEFGAVKSDLRESRDGLSRLQRATTNRRRHRPRRRALLLRQLGYH